jgi:HEPN domain-containing protein
VWFLSFFKQDDGLLNYEECNNVVIDWSLAKQTPCPEMKYSGIAMCEFSLIHSLDDLEASGTLLNNAHFSQSVFMSSQSVEKSLKSILSSYKSSFRQFIHLHSATALFKRLKESSANNPNHPFSRYLNQFETLCHCFENIGAESWTFQKPLSIRSRYFNYQSSTDPIESRYHYYVDSYPGIVYTSDLAIEAYEIAAEMFELCEIIFDEILKKF